MLLLPNEQQIVTSNDDKIVLTTQRIQLNDSEWGNSYQITIFLEHISSIEKSFKGYFLFLILGLLGVLLGAFAYFQGGSGDREITPLILLGGIVFLIIWFFSRKHIIKIKPDGGSSLNFVISKMSDETVEEFIYKVSLAKENRINTIHNTISTA